MAQTAQRVNVCAKIASLPCRARFGKAETARKAWSMLHETPCSPPVPLSREERGTVGSCAD